MTAGGAVRIARLALGILIAAGIGAGASAMLLDFLDKRPATIVKALFDANSVTFRDGRIQLYFDVTKVRDCPTTTTRWLWTWVDYNGKEMRLFMPLGVSFAGVTDVGNDRYLLSLNVPKGVWDGTWYYYARDVVQCGGLLSLLRNQVTETQPIPITIRGTSESAPKGITPAKAPPKEKTPLDPYRRAIIMNGEPLP